MCFITQEATEREMEVETEDRDRCTLETYRQTVREFDRCRGRLRVKHRDRHREHVMHRVKTRPFCTAHTSCLQQVFKGNSTNPDSTLRTWKYFTYY